MQETPVLSLGREDPHPTPCSPNSFLSRNVCHCWSFNGPEPGGSESKREKEADIPWFTWKANRVLFLGLALLHVDELSGLPRSKELARNERERGGGGGPKLWWSKGVLINMAWAYTLFYKVAILSKDKD